MVDPAIAEIGADAEGAADRAAMNAGNREWREWSADHGMRLGDRGHDAIKADRQRSGEQCRSDEKLLHKFSSIIVTLPSSSQAHHPDD
jgi:hypothetical protein